MGVAPKPDRIPAGVILIVAIVAVVTGLPSFRGGFLAGDDVHLVRNHVLVNHPSISHAMELFGPAAHRDLYQPIPLLSFSLDFAVINLLGLHPTTQGPHAGAWVFHLTNIFFHALNAVLVLLVLKRITRITVIAVVAAILFAVHPLSAEPIAWLNGRMMMLSTCFTLLSVIAFDRWDSKPAAPGVALIVLCVLLAHMSKVSVALPVLIAICPLAQHRMPAKRWWIMWAVVAVISGGFTLLNIGTSSQMFEIAEGEMDGPKILYCFLALAQYFRQYVVPIGLSVWYPPPPTLGWTDPAVIAAGVTVMLVAFLTVVSITRTRVVALGMLWFMAAVFPTLPIVPARRAIGADRYVYLPQIGLAWIVATAFFALYSKRVRCRRNAGVAHGFSRGGHEPTDRSSPPPLKRWATRPQIGLAWIVATAFFALYSKRRRVRSTRRSLLTAIAIIVGAACVGISWKTQGYHRDDISAALRNIQTNPDFPGVYKQAAWAYHRHGQYADAINIAAEDMARHPKVMACEVLQVIGMSQFRLGRYDDALLSLHKAIEADPKFGKCYSRLAQIQAHLGRYAAAIANYEHAVEIMPYYNPALLPLASLYRTVGRLDDALHTYHEVLRNNAYDVTAHLKLAEINIQQQRFSAAADRLTQLLDWMPENAVARTNLGVALEAMGNIPEAVDAFTVALIHDPRNATAAINLANLQLRLKRPEEARRVYESQMPYHGTDLGFLIAYHDFTLRINHIDVAAEAFIKAYNERPDDVDLRLWTAYTLAQAGDSKRAFLLLRQVPDTMPSPMRPLTAALLALADGAPETAVASADELLGMTPAAEVLERLSADLQRVSTARPDDPWPYFLMAKVLVFQGHHDLARRALDEFTRICPTAECASQAGALLP